MLAVGEVQERDDPEREGVNSAVPISQPMDHRQPEVCSPASQGLIASIAST